MQNLQSDYKTILDELKQEQIAKIKQRQEDKILEKENAEFLIKLIENVESKEEVLKLSALGMSLKRTGFAFDVRLEKSDRTIKYFVKNEKLSFAPLGEVDSKAESTKISDSKILDEKSAFSSDCARSYLEGNDEAQSCRIADLSLKAELQKPTPKQKITHTLIIGDNYPALLNLLINYKRKIKVIYIDPPYGKDDLGEFAATNYDNAITRDNLLSMLYPRLSLAKMLLQDDGVIFCSIDDRNQAYVKGLFDEVFGEGNFIFCASRLMKKGGKSTTTIAKNHDYVICYAKDIGLMEHFCLDERDSEKFVLEDEYVEERGKYALTQTLDYSSLQYSKNMDYPIEINGETFYAGTSYDKFLERQNGKHGTTDWVWRWSKSAVEWGLENGFIVVKNNRIYTKSYEKCRKKNGTNEIEFIEGKAYTTLSFLENENSNDNGKKELDSILAEGNSNAPFKNPKPSTLIKNLLKMVSSYSDNMDFESATTTGGGGGNSRRIA